MYTNTIEIHIWEIAFMDVGERIKSFRVQRNITVNKLANMAGISQSYLREIELGKKQPTVEYLEYICSALDISLKEFFSVDDSDVHPALLTALSKMTTEEQLKLADFINSLID